MGTAFSLNQSQDPVFPIISPIPCKLQAAEDKRRLRERLLALGSLLLGLRAMWATRWSVSIIAARCAYLRRRAPGRRELPGETSTLTHVVLPPPLAACQIVDPPPIRGPTGANLEVTPPFLFVGLGSYNWHLTVASQGVAPPR